MPRLEYVQVDTAADSPHPEGVPPICAAIRQAREEANVTQDELARRIGRTQSTVQKWEAGRQPTLDTIRRLEEALDHRRGQLLRLAGYVAEARTAREMLEVDPALTPNQRETMLAAYDVAVQLSSRARAARSARTPPTKPSKSRS